MITSFSQFIQYVWPGARFTIEGDDFVLIPPVDYSAPEIDAWVAQGIRQLEAYDVQELDVLTKAVLDAHQP